MNDQEKIEYVDLFDDITQLEQTGKNGENFFVSKIGDKFIPMVQLKEGEDLFGISWIQNLYENPNVIVSNCAWPSEFGAKEVIKVYARNAK